MIYEHIADAIALPKIVRLTHNIFLLRFECMKVICALSALEELKRRGVLKEGDTVIDSSSGIYAYSLALACHKHKLNCRIVASKTVDRTLRIQLEALGAIVDPAPPQETLKLDQEYRVSRIAKILSEETNIHWMQQYHDEVHYIGYNAVADMIAHSFPNERISLVGGIGSGCSTGALSAALQAQGRDVFLSGIQPFGSITFGAESVEDPEMIIAGIGSVIPFRNVRHTSYDEIHWVSFAAARAGAVALLQRHGAFAGLSTGACFTVANRAAGLHPDRVQVVIAADTGHRYVESVFARGDEALDIETLTPKPIEHCEELELPWSTMCWARREAREEAGKQLDMQIHSGVVS